jgi:hypothetical protein
MGLSESPISLEAFTTQTDFADQIADYLDEAGSGVADTVLVEGFACEPDIARFRLDNSVPLVGLRRIQRVGERESVAVVGQQRRLEFRKAPETADLIEVLRSRPGTGSRVEFTCYIDYSRSSYPSGPLRAHPYPTGECHIPLRFPSRGSVGVGARGGGSSAQVLLYKMGQQLSRYASRREDLVRISARVVSGYPQEQILEALSIRPATQLDEPDFEAEIALWKRICRDPSNHLGATV